MLHDVDVEITNEIGEEMRAGHRRVILVVRGTDARGSAVGYRPGSG